MGLATDFMLWRSHKFWLWLEVRIPTDTEDELEFADDELFGAGAQGPQGPQAICEPPPKGRKVCFELLSFSSDFELNAIPTASCSVAIGRRLDTVEKISAIHRRINDLKLQVPVTVWCLAKSLAENVNPGQLTHWPEGKFKIFEGYATGSSFRRTSAGAEVTLSMVHWLTDMNFSSALSKISHPLNPTQFYQSATTSQDVIVADGQFIGTAAPLIVGPHVAFSFFSGPTIINDFWGGFTNIGTDADGNPIKDGLKEWFRALTKQDRNNADQIRSSTDAAGQVSDLSRHKNWEACRALSRFEPNAQWFDIVDNEYVLNTESGYVMGTPLAMTTYGVSNELLAKSIAFEVGTESLEAYSSMTLWDKLAGQFTANYAYSVVPLVEKALVVPFIPGLQGNYMVHRTILASQYESLDMSAIMPRPLRAVGILVERGNDQGGMISKSQPAEHKGFGGWFDKASLTDDPRYTEGMVMLKTAPKWLSAIVGTYGYTPKSTGVSADSVQHVVAPEAGEPADKEEPREILKESRQIWNDYAHALYMHEALKGRQGTLNGPVRFDIAPGSNIRIEATDDKFVQRVLYPDAESPCDTRSFYYASVLRVSTVIDCQNMKMFTSLYFSHFRDAEENEEPGTSTVAHPVWIACRWGGCALVQDEAFAPLATKYCGE